MSRTHHSIATIESFLQEVGKMSKQAEEPLSEPGGHQGETTHPSKNVDDGLKPATEGARSAENKSDAKDQHPAGVDNTPEADVGDSPAEADQIQIGTNKQPTGEDPSNETSSVKGTKEDPGTSHPARTDNDALPGGKYASDTPLEKIAEDMQKIGNALCAQIHNMSSNGYAPTNKQAEDDDDSLAASAGEELAAILNGSLDKQAADQMVHATVSEIIRTAISDAEKVAAHLDGFQEGLQKAAMGEMGEASPEEVAAAAAAQAQGNPEAGGEGEGSVPPEELLSMLNEGGDEGEAGGEAQPMGDAGGEEAGGEADDTMALAQLLDQLQISPEELEQMLAEESGQGGGAGGGMVPPEAMQPKAAAAAGEKTAEMAKYVTELVKRSRVRKANS